jgi:hypothetical protein
VEEGAAEALARELIGNLFRFSGVLWITCLEYMENKFMKMQRFPAIIVITFLVVLFATACVGSRTCPVTEPAWVLPPEDTAVLNNPAYGFYFVNSDRSIWASAWWEGQDENYLVPGEDLKMGWFRPEGVDLVITGRRLDGDAPALEAQIPCCYPTRFQATGLKFPAAGCWEVTAQAADSVLTFVVKVER